MSPGRAGAARRDRESRGEVCTGLVTRKTFRNHVRRHANWTMFTDIESSRPTPEAVTLGVRDTATRDPAPRPLVRAVGGERPRAVPPPA